jgi:hypothetical protein
MRVTSRFITAFTTTIAAAVFAAGCSKKDAAPADTSTPAAAAPAPATAAAFSVVDIDMGRHIDADKKISDKTDDFAPNDTIYASVHTSGAATNQTVVGRWTFQDGQTVDERSQSISPTGDAYTEFHIVKPSGWPKGKYTLHVLVNGAEVRTKDVTVK